MRLLLLGVLGACTVDGPGALPPESRPRLVEVGGEGRSEFDALGFPLRAQGVYSHYEYGWVEAELRTIDKFFTAFNEPYQVHAIPHYRDGRLVAVESTCTGTCPAQQRFDELTYTSGGALATRSTRWPQREIAPVTTFHYDDAGRLVRVEHDGPDSQNDTITYGDQGCPIRIDLGSTSVTFDYENGKLVRMGYDWDGSVSAVTYNDAGVISRFETSAFWFEQPEQLVYEDEPVRGLDLWPGHTFGGSLRGFPVHGELFRVDGSCDPSLTAQPTIMAMVFGGLD